MIIDIPKSDDFFTSGWRFLNYGWSQAIDLLIDLQRWQLESFQPPSSDIQNFWELARPNLITSLALVQQGIELLLKGCIAEVSPYLLIVEHRSWDKFSKSDTPFAEFRTIDSQDLIKVYDTVRDQRLSENFKTRVNDLRKHRNKAFHTVSKSINVEASQILIAVFEAVANLNKGDRWLKIHRDFLEQDPNHLFIDIDYYVRSRMMREMKILTEELSPEDIRLVAE